MTSSRGTVPAVAVLMLVLLTACAHEPARLPAFSGQVRVEVADVAYDHSAGVHYLVLEEKAGRRVLPIVVGDDEAQAIMFELRGIRPPRPLTYELLLRVIQLTGNKLDRVVISDVRDEVYYATVYLDGGRYALDSRPSDAVALAIAANAPIFVAEKLLQMAAGENSQPNIRLFKAFDLTIQELTPELAEYFGVSTHSGVLVADVGKEAQRAGLQRGDIVTELDHRPLSTVDDFKQAAAAAISQDEPRVTLTIKRGDAVRILTIGRNRSDPRD
jgi:bifunctional DNase/RNase